MICRVVPSHVVVIVCFCPLQMSAFVSPSFVYRHAKLALPAQ